VIAPTLGTLAWAHTIQQIVSYGLLVPAQHVLFTVVSREDKYKAKGFIDTVVFRASDVVAANACDTLSRLGVGIVRMTSGMLPVTLAWLALGIALGQAFGRRSNPPPNRDAERSSQPTPQPATNGASRIRQANERGGRDGRDRS
jgi:AAA family ATP:ADP antiporter